MSTEDTTPAAVPGVTRWRKKPLEVEAAQWDGSAGARWLIAEWGGYPKTPPDDADALGIWVAKSQRMITLSLGDWAIRETDRTGVYPCAADVFAATYEPVSEPQKPTAVPTPDDPSRVPPSSPERSRPRAGAVADLPLAGCPTGCDADCELNPDGCHESHQPTWKRWHDPGWSCGEVQRAIAEAVVAERARAERAEAERDAARAAASSDRGRAKAAEGKLALIAAHCRSEAKQHPQIGPPVARADVILGIIGTGEEGAGNGC